MDTTILAAVNPSALPVLRIIFDVITNLLVWLSAAVKSVS